MRSNDKYRPQIEKGISGITFICSPQSASTQIDELTRAEAINVCTQYDYRMTLYVLYSFQTKSVSIAIAHNTDPTGKKMFIIYGPSPQKFQNSRCIALVKVS